MKVDNNHITELSSREELQAQIMTLKQRLDEAIVLNQAMWSLLVETSKRLQVSSAAIKAAVTSLLDYDIFWDGSTQHELLEIIDSSTDQVSDQITLLSLAFRAESKSLIIRPELNAVPEILSSVMDMIVDEYPDLDLDFQISLDSSPALVDYEYLSVALRLLFEVIAESQSSSEVIRVFTHETSSDWHIDIVGMHTDIIGFITTVSNCVADDLNNFSSIPPSHKLKLLVVCKILDLQSIRISVDHTDGEGKNVRLAIPLGVRV